MPVQDTAARLWQQHKAVRSAHVRSSPEELLHVKKGKEYCMVRTITRATLLGLMGTLLITPLVVAQQPSMSGPMSMETMMRECQTHCQETNGLH